MDGYRIDVDTGRVPERLALMRRLFGRPNSVYKAVRDTMEKRVLARFATKTSPEGKTWARWAPSTAAARAKEGGSAYKSGPVSLLEHTGAMKRSFFAKTVGGTVRVGFGVSYAQFHETGIPKSESHPGMPARPVLTTARGTQLARSDRIAVGIAVRRAIDASLDKVFR